MCSNINKIKHYLIEVKNISPLRIGNGEDDGHGLLIVDDHAVISGTTLAGLFRDFILKEKEIEKNNRIYELLFSPEIKIYRDNKEEKLRNTSKIYFYDAISDKKIDKDLVHRTHVHIDEKLGVSEDEHLFKEYHISEGKSFKIAFEVRGLEIGQDEYEQICIWLEEFISSLMMEKISVGSKSTFGFGIFKAKKEKEFYCKEYNLLDKNDFYDYLSIDRIHKDNLKAVALENVINIEIQIIFKGYCEDGLIIKSQNFVDKDRRVETSYKEAMGGKEVFLIPSSTIKGIIRNYSAKIYRTIGKDVKEIESIFGKKEDRDKNKAIKGKVVFKDCKLSGSCKETYNRIKIDRFTGGAMDGNLFSEELVVIPKEEEVEFKAILNEKDEKAMALIILAFRDIGLGYITIGSGNNVGYGRFKGKSISIKGKGFENYKVEFKDGCLQGLIGKFDELINILN